LLYFCLFHSFISFSSVSGIAQLYSAGLRVGWSGVRVPIGTGNFSLYHRVQTGSGAHPTSYPVSGALSLGIKRPGHEVTIPLHLVPRSRMCGAIPALPSTPSWRGAQLKHRDFTFYLYSRNTVLFVIILSLCLIKHHAMKAHWGSGGTAPRVLDLSTSGSEWSASLPGCFTPRERAPGTHWVGGWVGPRAVLDIQVVKGKVPSSRTSTSTFLHQFPCARSNFISMRQAKFSDRTGSA
jgi:hypothetical protein